MPQHADTDYISTENVEQSKKDIPKDFVMPEKIETKPPPKDDLDNDFWCESDEESFGDDSDGDMEFSLYTNYQFPRELLTDFC